MYEMVENGNYNFPNFKVTSRNSLFNPINSQKSQIYSAYSYMLNKVAHPHTCEATIGEHLALLYCFKSD